MVFAVTTIVQLEDNGRHAHAPVPMELIIPEFLPPQHWLTQPPVLMGEKAAVYLSHKIARSPKDLVSHLQRVSLYYRLKDADGVYGALLDLFIALGENGCSLRKRLLNRLAGFLCDGRYAALAHSIEKGIRSTDRVPLVAQSVLTDAVTGTTQLVERLGLPASTAERDPLEEARDMLDSYQLDAAQLLLERALTIDPRREDLSLELLGIYHHTRNHVALNATLNQLDGAPLAARDAWHDVARALST